ncbi:hemagglutinin/amebocyte aggregation factor-like isoform X2 [Chiloscyllium plagiosum]|uniref:hemagglutinin/amebocyte aggregation factor-like isoform X2 n=1 Tax=Chiloscyllium plagiosum TaxID=36176 RepID=UPI001CB82766|nr:hemagglutinin/amebocyte aggregation factor-like isoform X2 [Chiloscyllium plagiosum]
MTSSNSGQFNNKTDERVWDFACKATFRGIINCSWTDYVNNFDEGINFSCPSESLICGVENLQLPKHKDRKWKFYCCGKYTVCYANCAWTDYVNESKEYFSWLVPKGFYLVGAVRYHDSNSKYVILPPPRCNSFDSTVHIHLPSILPNAPNLSFLPTHHYTILSHWTWASYSTVGSIMM